MRFLIMRTRSSTFAATRTQRDTVS